MSEIIYCFAVRVGVKWCAAKGAEKPVAASIKPAHKANVPLSLPIAYTARKAMPPTRTVWNEDERFGVEGEGPGSEAPRNGERNNEDEDGCHHEEE